MTGFSNFSSMEFHTIRMVLQRTQIQFRTNTEWGGLCMWLHVVVCACAHVYVYKRGRLTGRNRTSSLIISSQTSFVKSRYWLGQSVVWWSALRRHRFPATMLMSGLSATPFLVENSKAKVLFLPVNGSRPWSPCSSKTLISIHLRKAGPLTRDRQVEVSFQLFLYNSMACLHCKEELLSEVLSLLIINYMQTV